MKRSFDPTEREMMDRPQPASADFERDLHNIRRFNRWFGSYLLISFFLQRWIKPGARLRIVDLATGSGDIPRLIADHARNVNAEVHIDALDQQPATLEIAGRLSADYSNIRFVEANILDWEMPEPYHIVFCTMALHHFSEEDAVCVLRRCRELSCKFVLVSDLRRSWFATIGVYLLTTTIFQEPMTKFDARLSMARAFSSSEMHDLAEQAGWENFGHKNFRFARQAVWLD